MSFVANAKGMLTTGHETGAAAIAIAANFVELGNRIAKCNFTATADPATGNNTSQGYYPGSFWLNSTSHTMFQCVTSSGSAATWTRVGNPITLPIAESDVTGLVGDLAGKAGATTVTSHIAATAAHGATGAVVGTTNTQVLSNKSFSDNVAAPSVIASGDLHLGGGGDYTLVLKTGGDATFAATIGGANGSWSIDGSGNCVFSAEVDCGSIVDSGLFYMKSSFKVRNKADDSWLDFITRNETGSEVVYDFTNIGSVTAFSFTGDGTNVSNIQSTNIAGYPSDNTLYLRGDNTWSGIAVQTLDSILGNNPDAANRPITSLASIGFNDATTQTTAYTGPPNIHDVLTAGQDASNLGISGVTSISVDSGNTQFYATEGWVSSQGYLTSAPTLASVLATGNDGSGAGMMGISSLTLVDGMSIINLEGGSLTNIQSSNLQISDGFNGSGAFTTFSFVNGICTSAS